MNLLGYIISYILGFLASLTCGLLLIYWQFTKSIAGYRLKKVEEATHLIINETKSTISYTGTLRNRYRYSLGVIIDLLIKTFGTKDIPKSEGSYLSMLTVEGDGWHRFNFYVRPVINDINNFSFIGWLTLLPQMKKLKILLNLCIQLENITAELDSIRLYSNSKGLNILSIKDGPILEIIEQKDASANAKIKILKNEYALLEKYWNEWLKVIGNQKF